MNSNNPLKSTPLLEAHKKLNAKLVPFAGWEMPIQYEGVKAEHLAVRNGVGIFDVSHMGEIDIKGPDAQRFIQYLVTNDIEKLSDGGILYTLMCYENGGVVDDLLVHKYTPDHYFLCVNAANTDKDFDWIKKNSQNFEVQIENISPNIVQLAIQGEPAENLLQKLSDIPLNEIQYYNFDQGKICGVNCLFARTGYTGEDGFEIYFDADKGMDIFEKILDEGKAFNLKPIGLGARDTLRLEMGYALYGNEINSESNPLEARLSWVIKLNKADNFIGKESLKQKKASGPKKRLTAIRLLERGVPRSHYSIVFDGKVVGEITSGTYSPCLDYGVALGYVPIELSKKGTPLQIKIRNQEVSAEVVELPFVPSQVKN